MSTKQLRANAMFVSASDPTTPTPIEGDTYFNSVTHILFTYNGSAWVGPSAVATLPDLVTSKLFATSDTTIAAGYGAVVPEQYTINDGFSLTIANTGILKIG